MTLQDLIKATCTIRGKEAGQSASGEGQGAFITPWHVLTAHHCLEGMARDSIVFESAEGVKTGIIGKGQARIIVDTKHDLAVVPLAAPIGENFLKFPRRVDLTDVFFRNTPLPLAMLTRRHGQEDAMRVASTGLVKQGHNLDGSIGYVLERFRADRPVLPGHSGSPIVDEEGHVVSVVSSIPIKPSELETVMGVFDQGGPQVPFRGAPQDAVYKIVRQALGLK